MTGDELRELLAKVMASLEAGEEEFRALDAAVGDGDLGLTVKGTAVAVREFLAGLEPGLPVEAVLPRLAQTVAKAKPSTMSALVAAGLLKAARQVGEDPVGVDGAAAAGAAFAETVGVKGKSARGDKTLLDALVPAVDAVREVADRGGDGAEAIEAAVHAARQGVDDTTALAGRKGRARWMGDRSAGHPDPGAVVVQRFLEAWHAHH